MAETITLPRSGVVLTSDPGVLGFLVGHVGPIRVKIIAPLPQFEIKWRTWIGDHFDGDLPSLETAVACLDARVLELRAALMPADARERVANELLNQSIREGRFTIIGSPAEREQDALVIADAVLAALGGQP